MARTTDKQSKKIMYIGPADIIDVGNGLERVPKEGLPVSLTDTQIKSMKARGHRFEGHEVAADERAKPSQTEHNYDPAKYTKMITDAVEAETVPVETDTKTTPTS